MQVCTSSQTTTPTSHHSVFYRPDALPAAQPTASKHWFPRAVLFIFLWDNCLLPCLSQGRIQQSLQRWVLCVHILDLQTVAADEYVGEEAVCSQGRIQQSLQRWVLCVHILDLQTVAADEYVGEEAVWVPRSGAMVRSSRRAFRIVSTKHWTCAWWRPTHISCTHCFQYVMLILPNVDVDNDKTYYNATDSVHGLRNFTCGQTGFANMLISRYKS